MHVVDETTALFVFQEMISMLFGAKSRCYRESFSFRPRHFEGFIIYGALTVFMMPLGGQAVVLSRLLLAELHSCILMDALQTVSFSLPLLQRALTVPPQCSTTKRWMVQHHKTRVQLLQVCFPSSKEIPGQLRSERSRLCCLTVFH